MQLSTRELAELLIYPRFDESWERNTDDEWDLLITEEIWITSSRNSFASRDDAIEHEIAWLREQAEA